MENLFFEDGIVFGFRLSDSLTDISCLCWKAGREGYFESGGKFPLASSSCVFAGAFAENFIRICVTRCVTNALTCSS